MFWCHVHLVQRRENERTPSNMSSTQQQQQQLLIAYEQILIMADVCGWQLALSCQPFSKMEWKHVCSLIAPDAESQSQKSTSPVKNWWNHLTCTFRYFSLVHTKTAGVKLQSGPKSRTLARWKEAVLVWAELTRLNPQKTSSFFTPPLAGRMRTGEHFSL